MSNAPGFPQGPGPGMPSNPYAAQGSPATGGLPPPAAPSHFGTWWWAYLLGVPAVFFMCCCGGCLIVGALVGPQGAMAMAAVTQKVTNHPLVQDKLGTPITTGSMSTFKVNTNNDTTTATFEFQIKGPKGEATVYTDMRKQGTGDWTYDRLRVTFQDGTAEDLQ